MRLQNKVALVTGGATGIGAATAVMYAREGAKVIIADLNETAGKATAQSIESEGGTAQFVRTDVSQEADVAALMEGMKQRFGRLDVLVTCAGILLGAAVRIDQFDADDWDAVIRVNLRGTFLCTKHAVPLMEECGGGVIVLIASGAGVTGPQCIGCLRCQQRRCARFGIYFEKPGRTVRYPCACRLSGQPQYASEAQGDR